MIAGLGNPGSQYDKTRHNIGFMALDELATRFHASWNKGKWNALCATTTIQNISVVLIKPQTFMNLSGQSVQPALVHYKLKPENLLVVHDEIDLEFGDLKIKEGGGHRGHNGLRDIKARLGGGDFDRIRFGVGRPPNEHMSVADYVLGRFTPEQKKALPDLLEKTISMIEDCVKNKLA